MSGTSADGVDAALLYTDGGSVTRARHAVFLPYDASLRAGIFALMAAGERAASHDTEAMLHTARLLTDVHFQAVEKLLAEAQVKATDVAVIGFHGQTIAHAPERGFTLQIGDASWLARQTGIAVVYDFRSNDMRHGGQGAPLVPLYHAALATDLARPVIFVNIGGVANVTWVGEIEREERILSDSSQSSTDDGLLAFDCGPGNALVDDWVRQHSGAAYDAGGALAAQGKVDDAAVQEFLSDPFFVRSAPKSLDRNHFRVRAMRLVANASAADGAATLTAMSAAAIARACAIVPQTPTQVILCGGGRHNHTLVAMLAQYTGVLLSGGRPEIKNIDRLGRNGDATEAEAFAYLAARSVQKLPLSFPGTTGVSTPVTGGELVLLR